jgi:TolA-binding protein
MLGHRALTFENFFLTDTRNEKRNSIDTLQQQVRALQEEVAALEARVKELAEQKSMLEKQKIDTGTLSEDAQHAIAQLQKDLERAAAREGNEKELLTSKKTQLDEARAAGSERGRSPATRDLAAVEGLQILKSPLYDKWLYVVNRLGH